MPKSRSELLQSLKDEFLSVEAYATQQEAGDAAASRGKKRTFIAPWRGGWRVKSDIPMGAGWFPASVKQQFYEWASAQPDLFPDNADLESAHT